MRPGLRALPLQIVVVCTLAGLLGAPHWLAYVAGGALLVFVALEWRWQSLTARLMLTGGVLLAGFVLYPGGPGAVPLLADALARAAFFATFITCLGMLRLAAARSPLVKRCGAALIRQPPRWRYATLFLGSAAFGLILNLGVIALLGVMSLKGNTLAAAGGHAAVQQARTRRMLNAILRGFSLAPIISPLGIALAVILSSYPQLRWLSLLPYAAAAAAILFLAGWAQDRITAPRHLASLVPENPGTPLAPLGQFAAVLLAIVLFTWLSARAAGTRLPNAVLFTVPISAFVWMALQRRRLDGGLGLRRAAAAFRRRSVSFFPGMRTEVTVLGSAGFIGVVLAELLPRSWAAERIVELGLSGTGLAALATALVVLAAQVGLNPIVSVTLLASALPEPMALGVPVPLMAVGLMAGWGLAMVTSPLTASMLITARLARASPYTVGYGWNGPYVAATCLLLWLTATLYGLWA